jgi:hypothetical protein
MKNGGAGWRRISINIMFCRNKGRGGLYFPQNKRNFENSGRIGLYTRVVVYIMGCTAGIAVKMHLNLRIMGKIQK